MNHNSHCCQAPPICFHQCALRQQSSTSHKLGSCPQPWSVWPLFAASSCATRPGQAPPQRGGGLLLQNLPELGLRSRPLNNQNYVAMSASWTIEKPPFCAQDVKKGIDMIP